MREEERLALVTWSAIAEPGDAVASALVGLLGPVAALAWTRSAASDPAGAVLELGGGDLASRTVAAVERWTRRKASWDPGQHLERAAKIGARVVARGDEEWPEALDDLGDAAPYCLWIRGPLPVKQAWVRSIAVVGSRSNTAYGGHVAAALAADLTDEGYTIVSGGAYGIDASAHRGALSGEGRTVAVMAGGVDRLYPAGNQVLHAVLDSGAILGESPPGYAPHRSRFLTRNRIIATARVTVVVEAAHRSGALSTAFHAAGLGRTVAAVPGPVTSPSSAGCHRLIRDGAVLVTGARDVVEAVEPLDASRSIEADRPTSPGTDPRPSFSSPAERQAYDAVSGRGSTTEQVAAGAGLTVAEARAALGGLLLSGEVCREGVQWRRAKASEARPRR